MSYGLPRSLPIINPDIGSPTPMFYQWLQSVLAPSQKPFSGTIVTAKLTPGGATGQMVFLNGVLQSQVAAT